MPSVSYGIGIRGESTRPGGAATETQLRFWRGRHGIRRDKAREAFRARRREECGGGYEDLSPARIAPIFDRVTGIPRAGFTEVRSGWWVRPGDGGIFEVLQFLRSSRGYDYRFRWGVSLDWVPRVTGARLRWHRTMKSAQFDLWDQAHDYLIGLDTPWREADVFFPDRSLGEECFEADLSACWSKVEGPIVAWWAGASTVQGVLARAEEQSGRAWEGADHAPDPDLVAAFTLARLGRVGQARTRLKAAREFSEWSDELQSGIEQVAARGSASSDRR